MTKIARYHITQENGCMGFSCDKIKVEKTQHGLWMTFHVGNICIGNLQLKYYTFKHEFTSAETQFFIVGRR